VSSAGLSRYETDGILATRPGYGTLVPRELGRWINLILGFCQEMARRGIRVSNRTLHNIDRTPSTVELGEGFDLSRSSIYMAIEAKDTRPIRVLQANSASPADTLVATSLGIEPGLPLLKIIRMGLHTSNLATEYVAPYFRPDGDPWITELKRSA
jgi:GntR family transcriptional regulator